ncbi:hypothetical protein Nepgr_002061 [Nepenthes gracilis]|uniref:Uncharacterized protein n=1 Tax=Nepenthes gracilis TaxID=150966 RepID=A0AAD3P6E9_NEPGR|nr:hypothetical protein Nepgr_002061 [Nepenthes gracilis]
MAPSFDGALSSLLCAEDNLSIFYGADNVGLVDDFQINASHHRNHRTLVQELGFNGGEGFARLLPMASEECLSLMIERETEHLPGPDYLSRLRNGDLDLKARKEAVDWICRVQSHYNFGPLSAYLSINYLDRFLSTYKLPGKVWMVPLLAVAALSLAAKMEETEVPLSLDLQIGESKFIFESKTIQRMELLVLSTLKWRMQSVTPFSLVDYFLCKLNGDQMPPRSSICRSIQLIMSTIKGIDFLEFRPSEIAAAVAISVTVETETVDTSKVISLISEHVEKERLLICLELVHDLLLAKGSLKVPSSSSASVPQSPVGVLDAACLSYKSDDTPAVSCPDSTQNSPAAAAKRRKLSNTSEVDP